MNRLICELSKQRIDSLWSTFKVASQLLQSQFLNVRVIDYRYLNILQSLVSLPLRASPASSQAFKLPVDTALRVRVKATEKCGKEFRPTFRISRTSNFSS